MLLARYLQFVARNVPFFVCSLLKTICLQMEVYQGGDAGLFSLGIIRLSGAPVILGDPPALEMGLKILGTVQPRKVIKMICINEFSFVEKSFILLKISLAVNIMGLLLHLQPIDRSFPSE